MKKVFKLSMIALVALFSLFTLASCGGVSESMAEDINKAAEKDEHFIYSELMDKLGDPVIDATIKVLDSRNGVVTWAKGYDNFEDYKAALEDEKEVKVLVVTFVDNKARSAVYEDGKAE